MMDALYYDIMVNMNQLFMANIHEHSNKISTIDKKILLLRNWCTSCHLSATRIESSKMSQGSLTGNLSDKSLIDKIDENT